MIDQTIKDHIINHRNKLHQIPELGFDLFKTSTYVKNQLETFGYQVEVMAKTGLVAVKKGRINDAIAFRSDMDALPVKEQSNFICPSIHGGQMHACGHDGHMAILLGFAEYVSRLDLLDLSVVFVFQPAEEGPGGAKIMIEEGLIEKYHIKEIYGIHLYPQLKEGIYGIKSGPLMARNGEFDIKVLGKSSHGAEPHHGIDSIVASSELVLHIQSIVSRMIDPLEPIVVTIGTISGGEARNIISKEVHMSGTIRTFNDDVYEQIKKKLHSIVLGTELTSNAKIELVIRDYYPPVINDQKLYDRLMSALDQSAYQMIKPMMLAEDFAFYQKKVPGLFVMLGTKNDELGFNHPLHSAYFDFDTTVLFKGVALYIQILNTYL
jgi:amidohydrolase